MAATAGCDWEWAKRTGGILSPKQRRQYRWIYIKGLPTGIADKFKYTLGFRGTGFTDFDRARPQPTKLTIAAQIAAETLSEAVYHHSVRCYWYARIFAEQDGVEFDDELVYAACLLHDLNLESPTPGRCFAVEGALRAVQIALKAGVPPERADQLGATIATHMNLGIAHDLADPAGAVAAGAMADVYGPRMTTLDPGWVEELLLRHPRHNFSEHAIAAMTTEAEHVEHGRVHWLVQHGGAIKLIRRDKPADQN